MQCMLRNVYDGKAWRHLNVRVGEYSGISPLTGKKLESKKVYSSKRPYAFL